MWQTWISPCPADIAGQFLTDPTSEPDAACVAAMTPGSFLTSDDIHPTPAIYRANDDVALQRDPTQIALLVACAVAFVVGFVAGIVALIRRRGRQAGAAVMILMASVAGPGYAGATFAVLRTSDPIIPAFGIPAAAHPLLVAGGILTAVVTVAVVGVAVNAWTRRHDSLSIRIILTIVAAASALFTGWLLARGLLFW